MRGINLGGAFDRRDGRRGWKVQPVHLDAIVGAGFDSVRLPVRWWDEGVGLLPDVVALVEACWARGLSVVVTMHHADEVMEDPVASAPHLLELWSEIAAAFVGSDGSLAFELLNEPRAPLTAEDWNALLPAVLGAVREVDAERLVLVGGADASTVAGLRALELPPDEHLLATVHYYEPFRFTHQGASWEPGVGRLARDALGHAGRPRRRHRGPRERRGLGSCARCRAVRQRVRHDRSRGPRLASALDRLGPARARATRRAVGVLGLRNRLRRLRPGARGVARRSPGRPSGAKGDLTRPHQQCPLTMISVP